MNGGAGGISFPYQKIPQNVENHNFKVFPPLAHDCHLLALDPSMCAPLRFPSLPPLHLSPAPPLPSSLQVTEAHMAAVSGGPPPPLQTAVSRAQGPNGVELSSHRIAALPRAVVVLRPPQTTGLDPAAFSLKFDW